ncbi:FAD-dependent monooxygenase [Amantichitinum ursilacus]|uniref:2-octaprenyl-6-methoxyphenol hydroxylase n=1 Tax=Amantichitinum ursilacus TaxID=857265 RepID=A0A0N0GQ12_9NEIS|nr:FAD-dependent monooxygenase [Amantichitinum ursilacus]KPC54304.1 2-octaprenyl-6-methoxyphenol hydroxylase [Amantichitinum ursilacus]
MIVKQLPLHVDIAIVGGGPVGALVAQRLARQGRQALVIEARDATATPPSDPRALALSWASYQALDEAGLWSDALAPTAIQKVHVSQQGSLGRTGLDADELNLPALGFVVPYETLAAQALQHMVAGSVQIAANTRVSRIQTLSRYAALTLQTAAGEAQMTARLVILADGGKLIDQVHGVTQTVRPYNQHAVLARMTPNTPHSHIAYERFADDGPIALLPFGTDFMLIWTQTPEQAEERLGMDDAAFMAAVAARFAGRLDGFSAVGPRKSWPLALKTLDRVYAPRTVMIGNAAQTLHPVAGQGLNLGLRDAAVLADVLASTPDPMLGEASMLQRYAALRRKDAGIVTHFTDTLITLFDRPNPALKHARSLGLLALDQIAPLRRGFARRMVYGVR